MENVNQEAIGFDPAANGFETKNHKYRIVTGSSTIERFQAMETWEIIMMNYESHRKYVGFFKEIKAAFNESDFVKVATMISDGQMMFGYMEEKIHPVLMYCAIFILREDEDIKSYDENFSKEKINDWREEGLDMLSFFALCLRVSPTLKEGYNAFIQSTLEGVKKRTIPED